MVYILIMYHDLEAILLMPC